MSLQLAFQQEDVWMAVVIIAAWLVFMCLRHVGNEIEHGIRRHNLQVEAKMLRMRQTERLRAITDYVE